MSPITLDQQIPITKVRNNLASVFKDVQKKKVYYVVKNYTPKAVIADVDYFQQLEKDRQRLQMVLARRRMAADFNKWLVKKGYDPNKMTEKQINKILMLDD